MVKTCEQVEFMPGCHISEAAQILVVEAKEHGSAEGTFNGILLRAAADTTADEVEHEFLRESERRHAAWLVSPEGIAAAKESEQRRVAMQSKHDALMARISTLKFDSPYVVLDWLCEMQEPSDHRGVIIRRETIVSAFEKHGYNIGANCGAAYRHGNAENMFRWIVGQALDGLKNGPAIHPIIHKFAKEWRDQFPEPSDG